jgi:5-methylcytosine-specific restriction protein B
MTIDEASKLLAKMYFGGGEKEKATQVHLFGIRYAKEIDGLPLKEVASRAGIPESYGTEIRKGINLAQHVTLKADR